MTQWPTWFIATACVLVGLGYVALVAYFFLAEVGVVVGWWMANRRARHQTLHADDWLGEGGQRP